jgi:glycosyltransferase involved in cell wall biosynthesis
MSARPFLTIVTRSYKKPKCLKKNIESVKAQIDQDLEQIFIIDDVGRGLAWADTALNENKHRNNGKYIMVLDDDDIITHKNFVALIKQIAERTDPDVIIWRGKFTEINVVLPPLDAYWKVRPNKQFIGSFNYCIRKEIYDEYIHVCCSGSCGDYDLIYSIFARQPSPKVFWYNKIFVSTQQKSRGTEQDLMGD